MLPYLFSLFGTIFCAASLLIKGKDMRLILLLIFLGNSLAGVGYLLTPSGINGAVTCFVGAAITIVNFLLEQNGKAVPKWLTALYAVMFVSINLWVSVFSAGTLFIVLAALAFVLSTVQKSGKPFRVYTLINGVCWILYDVLSASYQGLVVHIPVFLITVVGMLIHDRTKKSPESGI